MIKMREIVCLLAFSACFWPSWGFLRPCSSFSTPRLNAVSESSSKPRWAGNDDLLSLFVNMLINFKPLFGLMKPLARSTLIKTAETNGIPWINSVKIAQKYQNIFQRNLDGIVKETPLSYPGYYTQEFHAYDEGNLNFQAAHECESATLSMALRVWPKDGYSAIEAQDKLRYSFLDAVNEYLTNNKIKKPRNAIDIGCSVGISTFYLSQYFDSVDSVDGLDLSPYFLSVALARQNRALEGVSNSEFSEVDDILLSKFTASTARKIKWIYANAENTGLTSNAYDLAAVSFMFHELPSAASDLILSEMYRITAPGGVIAITDNNPKSAVIQNLPPVLFTLMKSTEPHSDQYYSYDVEAAMRKAGFTDVTTIETDPRHRTIIGKK